MIAAEPMARVIAHPTVTYLRQGTCYLNITSRCTLSCSFCPKTEHRWLVNGVDLHLAHEPTVDQVLLAVGDAGRFDEIAFCGLGEPTLRLYELLEMGAGLRRQGARRIRVVTDGLANLVYRRDVTPDLDGFIDALSISLNAQNEDAYNYYCRPRLMGAYPAVLDFADRARAFVVDVCLTAIEGLPGVDIAACECIARRLGVRFRRRQLDDV